MTSTDDASARANVDSLPAEPDRTRPSPPDSRPPLWSAHSAVLLLMLAVPVIGLWLVIAQPKLDGRWEHHLSHFWLVLGVALVNVAIAVRMNEQTRRRADTRLFLVSMAFLSSAGFLALHALTTPDVLVGGNAGFEIATPVGLLLAAVFAAISSIEFTAARQAAVMRNQAVLRAGSPWC